MIAYYFQDQGASVRVLLVSDIAKDLYILKSEIKGFQTGPSGMVKMELLSRPPVYIHWSQVNGLGLVSELHLIITLNEWLTKCGCMGDHEEEDDGGGGENPGGDL